MLFHLFNYEKKNVKTEIYINSITKGIVFYAYENKIDPDTFQQKVIRMPEDVIGFSHAKDLNNIHITDKSIEQIYCADKDTKNKILYVTNANLVETFKMKRAIKTIYSDNGVLKLFFVYGLNDIVKNNVEGACLLQNH